MSTASTHAASSNILGNTHTGIHPPPEDSETVPRKQWPRLIRSQTYNPDYPTFCECLQPHCPRHSIAARDILARSCTTFSWPPPEIIGLNCWSPSAGLCANEEVDTQVGHFGKDAGACEWDPSQRECAKRGTTVSEHKPRVQSNTISPFSLPPTTTKAYAHVVPELASLLDHMERRDPLLVISTTDANMDSVLPFQLPSEYGCVVLGFFDVERVEAGIWFLLSLGVFALLKQSSA